MLFILLITILLAVPFHSSVLTTSMIARLTTLGFGLSLLLSWNSYLPSLLSEGLTLYNGLFSITSVSIGISELIFLLVGLICLSLPFQSTHLPRELPLIFIFTTLGGILMITSANLISLFLSIELQSFSVYIIATLDRQSESGTSAGLMYFLLGALASCLILLGCGLLYTSTGCLDLNDLEQFINSKTLNNENHYINSINIGIILLLIGCLFKIAAAPLHNWSITVYDAIPTLLVTWLAVIPKISLLTILLTLNNIGNIELLLISGILSIIIGSLLGLSQNRIKRLLAYSSVSHVGFMLLSISIGTVTALIAFLLYLIQYSLTALTLFLILLSLVKKLDNNRDILTISEFRGLFIGNPLLAFSISVCFFSMAGVPFLIGFFAKLEVLNACLESHYSIIALIAIIMSVISAGYYLNIIQYSFDITQNWNNYNDNILRVITIQSSLAFVIALLTLMLMSFLLNPSLWMNPIHLIVLNLYYT